MESWRSLGLQDLSGEENMSLDRRLFAEAQTEDRVGPVLRFYTWRHPTVSLGANQREPEVVNRVVAERLGYDIVRRPTGGRALLHKGDLCYAVVARRTFHPLFRTLTSTYRSVGSVLAESLIALGVSDLKVPQSSGSDRLTHRPCFGMLSPFELTVDGRKICGSAQFRSGEVFLQHGSLRIRDCWSEADLRDLWPDGYQLDSQKVTCLDEAVGRRLDFQEICLQIETGFRRIFAIDLAEA